MTTRKRDVQVIKAHTEGTIMTQAEIIAKLQDGGHTDLAEAAFRAFAEPDEGHNFTPHLPGYSVKWAPLLTGNRKKTGIAVKALVGLLDDIKSPQRKAAVAKLPEVQRLKHDFTEAKTLRQLYNVDFSQLQQGAARLSPSPVEALQSIVNALPKILPHLAPSHQKVLKNAASYMKTAGWLHLDWAIKQIDNPT